MVFAQLSSDSSKRDPLDTVKLIAPQPVSCGVTP
jgi:hypothetical protein